MSVFPRVGRLNIMFTCVFNCISYDVILPVDDQVLLGLCVRICIHCNGNTANLCLTFKICLASFGNL